LGEQVESGDVGDDLERWGDGDGDQRGGRRGEMDGATSGARRDSKRVETGPLAEDETDQHGQREREMAHVPRPSTPHPIDHRHPTDQPNPPRRRGRLKTRPTKVSNPRWTYQATRTHRGRIGRIGRIVHDVYGPEMVEASSRDAKREDQATGVDRGRARAPGQRDHLAEARLTISGNRSSARPIGHPQTLRIDAARTQQSIRLSR
jgi:hypothetical protein